MFSAIEIFLVMRYINLLFTYYLLTMQEMLLACMLHRTRIAEMEQHSPSTAAGVENIQLQHTIEIADIFIPQHRNSNL